MPFEHPNLNHKRHELECSLDNQRRHAYPPIDHLLTTRNQSLPESQPYEFDSQISEIIGGAQLGDSLAESEIHQKFVDRLVRLASQRINDRFQSKIAPEEIVQSVFASFFRRHRGGEFELEDWNDLWALLVKITLFKSINKIKQFQADKRDVKRELQQPDNVNSWNSLFATAREPGPEEMAIFHESLDQLFDKLSDAQREMVCLRLRGMSTLEISETLNCSERTVFRTLKKVKEIFAGKENE